MGFSLDHNLHSCMVNGKVIFLDALVGRYFCLPDRLEGVFVEAARGGQINERGPEIREMIGRGLLVVDTPDPKPLLPDTDPPALYRDLSDNRSRASLSDVATAAAAQARAAIVLRTRRFQQILSMLQISRNATQALQPGNDGATAIRFASALQATSLLFGSSDRCLNRSLALLQLCYRRGSRPTFVIGVRTDPFVAHCWVQQGDVVLNDRSEHARLFARIFTL